MHGGARTKGETAPLETGTCFGWLDNVREHREREKSKRGLAGTLIRPVKDKSCFNRSKGEKEVSG